MIYWDENNPIHRKRIQFVKTKLANEQVITLATLCEAFNIPEDMAEYLMKELVYNRAVERQDKMNFKVLNYAVLIELSKPIVKKYLSNIKFIDMV